MRALFLSISFLIVSWLRAQDITVTGRVNDETGRPVGNFILVNQRTGSGTFCTGNFSTKARQSDTLIISAKGFQAIRFCPADSQISAGTVLAFTVQKLSVQLKEVAVHAIKTPSEVRKDIDNLGVRKTNTYQKVDAFSSPITALWERFSKIEKQKREVAKLENDDRRAKILKDLFRNYISYDIIDLSDEEFDDFIRFLNFSDDFMRNSTDYELAQAIKSQYKAFKNIPDKRY